jgi:hypothetical protein
MCGFKNTQLIQRISMPLHARMVVELVEKYLVFFGGDGLFIIPCKKSPQTTLS